MGSLKSLIRPDFVLLSESEGSGRNNKAIEVRISSLSPARPFDHV